MQKIPVVDAHASTELEKAGERLQQVGLNEQALDQYIQIWTLGESNAADRAKAAATTGRLYLKAR